ncbi:MAG: T9SS type A sorting domain-containing protein [Bacteroidetes bacterium]|nr:T9SS type A sorting domain-containing protein [Bacteroidota bacterium]
MLFYDLLGRVEFEKYLEKGTDFVDVSSLKSGIYILSIEEPNGRIAKLKIMKI